MNIITGCLAATAGRVRIGGYDIFDQPEQAKRLIGYLPEQPPLYLDMTPDEYLSFVAAAKGVPRAERAGQIEEAIRETQIAGVRRRIIRNLSKGYRQRVGIAQALIGNPQVIILDEPTVGLDPLQIIEIRDFIRALGAKHTVILSSHILSEVRAVCDKVLIIAGGKLVACDTPNHLERLFVGTASMQLIVRATEAEVAEALGDVPGVAEYTTRPGEDPALLALDITLSAPDAALAEALFFAFCHIGRPILEMRTQRASLEDVFIELTRETPAAAIAAPPDAPEPNTSDAGEEAES
jgi:ABC-2 type transport system ATP-binding protein